MVAMNLPGAQLASVARQLPTGESAQLGSYPQYGLVFRFGVVVDSLGDTLDLGDWASCTGLGVTFTAEDHKVGGVYDHANLRPGQVTYTDVILERVVARGSSTKIEAALNDFVAKWVNWSGSGDEPPSTSVAITLLDSTGNEAMSWTLRDAIIKSWTGPSLNSGKDEVATEKLVLVHQGFLNMIDPEPGPVRLANAAGESVVFKQLPEKWTAKQGVKLKSSDGVKHTKEQQVTSIDDRVITMGKMRLYGSASIEEYGNRLFSWVTTTDTTSAASTKATVLRLTIGQSVKDMEVVLRDVDVDFLRFDAQGLPTCADFKLTLVQRDRGTPMLNPTSGGRWANRTHTVVAGDSLQWIAESNYRSPGAWRMVAEENGIDDPLRVRAGNVLLLPRTAD